MERESPPQVSQAHIFVCSNAQIQFISMLRVGLDIRNNTWEEYEYSCSKGSLCMYHIPTSHLEQMAKSEHVDTVWSISFRDTVLDKKNTCFNSYYFKYIYNGLQF